MKPKKSKCGESCIKVRNPAIRRYSNDTNYSIASDPACLIPAEVLHHLIENVWVFIVDVLVEIGPRLQFFVADEALNVGCFRLIPGWFV